MHLLRFKTCALALFAQGLLTAQEPVTAAQVTESGRTLERALDLLLAGTPSEQPTDRTMLLLVDGTRSLQLAGFTDVLSAALSRIGPTASLRLAVMRVGDQKPLLMPTEDRAAVVSAVGQILAAPDEGIRNVFADLRHAAQLLGGRAGQREVVLVTLENGDAEDDLEGTVSRLQRAGVRAHVLTSEAYVADSYWTVRSHERGPRGTKLTGGDAPFIDLPHGWLFQMTTANEVTPASFASYALNRVAGGTGGKVYLYTPPDLTPHRCAVYGSCLFCNGDHVASDEIYFRNRLELLAPPIRGRGAIAGELARDPWFRVTSKAWQDAHRTGLISSQPPRLGSTVASAAPVDRADERRLLMFTSNLARNADRAEQLERDCARILDALDAELRAIEPQSGHPRQRAIAEFTRLMLQLTRVNLRTFAGWCRDVAPAWLAKEPPVPEPPEISPLYREDRASGIGYTNHCLCHGVLPFLSVELPGGKALQQELQRLEQMSAAFLVTYANSPFVIAWHRMGVARFHLTYPGVAVTVPRDRQKSKTAPETPPTTGGRPPRAGTQGSGEGSGPTTGGGR